MRDQGQGWQQRVRQIGAGVRRRVLEHVVANNGGYLSQACSAAEILAVLYGRVMKLGPSQAPPIPARFVGVFGSERASPSGAAYNGPKAPDLDRFFFSPVHYALALYATLIEVGRLDPGALQQFNRDGSTVEMIAAEHSPGIETMAGSLAQTLSQAAGVAMARRMRGDTGRVWVFMSDGEFQEGQTWEALAAIAHHRLDRLGVFIDRNGQQCDGAMDHVMGIDPLPDRLRAFGVDVFEVDGHEVEALAEAAGRQAEAKARAIICNTDPCRGVELLRRRYPDRIHHVRFKDAVERGEYEAVLRRMNEHGR